MSKNGDKETKQPGGLLGDVRDSDFPSELMKANANFEEAVANTIFRDDIQHRDCILYHAWLTMMNLVEEIQEVTNFLNGRISIGGYSRVLAASAHIGMLHPSSLGVKLSKEGEKAWAETAAANRRQHVEDREKEKDRQ